jgi:predicted metallopeptidase
VRRFTSFSRRKNRPVDWQAAPDVTERVRFVIEKLDLTWLEPKRIFGFRSKNTKTRAYARIWGLSKVFQLALRIKPAYVIEVISEKYDKLPQEEQDKILLHELVHIPRNFSGSLVPHIRKKGKRNFEDKVHQLVSLYKKMNK